MKYSIELLSSANVVQYRALKLQALEEGPGLFAMSAEEYSSKGMGEIANQLQPTDSSFACGAFDEAEMLVGVVELHRRELRKLDHLALVSGMYVIPETRRSGIGRALLNDVVTRAAQLPGLVGLVLVVAADDEPAIKLYLSLGFESYGREPLSLRLPDRYVEGVQMILPLAHVRTG